MLRLTLIRKFLLAFILALQFSKSALALPWDIDMYSQQSLKANEIARAPVEGTIPLGYAPFTMTIEEADKNLNNPVPSSPNTLWRGKRLWSAQCSSCHGLDAKSKTNIGKLLGAPNLTEERFQSYSDGKIYGTIVWGIRTMPRYGYKLSDEERWDIVNYFKNLQGR
jgi:mono/diheme cytochrome c family protein